MLEFLLAAFIFFVLFWISLHPGSRLGFAITGGDFVRSLHHLNQKKLQTREKLRTAGQKSLAFWTIFTALGTLAGVSDRSYSFQDAALGFAGGILTGVVLGYALLHWGTRKGGWYGVA